MVDAFVEEVSRILLLRVAYKANIADQRESPSKPVVVARREMGADLAYWDPYVDEWFTPAAVRRTEVLRRGTCDFDCVVLLQPHRELD
jgi:UDP-N-acetyl-D-mannosaminuronate dehydrogenase